MTRLILALCFFANITLSAQSLLSATNLHVYDLTDVSTDNWSFYSDVDSKLLYIDFEKLNFNISDIVIVDQQGEEIFKDDVLNLPVNSLYELDLNNFKAGKYQIELRTFKGTTKKDLVVK